MMYYPLVNLFLVQICPSYFQYKSDDSTEEAWGMDNEGQVEALQLKYSEVTYTHRHLTIQTAFWVLSAIHTHHVPFELLDSAALLWRESCGGGGPNSSSKFDHHNINGGAVDDTWRAGRRLLSSFYSHEISMLIHCIGMRYTSFFELLTLIWAALGERGQLFLY
jgi:hypothetical protein